MPTNSQIFNTLVSLLKKEIDVHRQYYAVLKEQRDFLTTFQTDKMQALNETRSRLNRRVKELHDQRLSLMKELDSTPGKKLTDIVKTAFTNNEQKVISPLVKELKEIVTLTKQHSVEFQGVTNFALNMVHGSICLLWQATQNVTKHYGKNGIVQESYAPTRSRHERVLKQA